jgi:hypothetical protein
VGALLPDMPMNVKEGKAILMKRDGKKWSEITEATGLQGGQLYRLFKLHGLIQGKKHISTDPDFMDKCAKLKRKGLMNKEIAATLEVSDSIVSAALKRRGFSCKGR